MLGQVCLRSQNSPTRLKRWILRALSVRGPVCLHWFDLASPCSKNRHALGAFCICQPVHLHMKLLACSLTLTDLSGVFLSDERFSLGLQVVRASMGQGLGQSCSKICQPPLHLNHLSMYCNTLNARPFDFLDFRCAFRLCMCF